MDVIRCEAAGLRFVRGSRRQMVKASLRRLAGVAPPEGSFFWALRGIDLRLRAGDRVGVCGGNGAGKTTLLRLLCGIYEPDEGEVRVAGRACALLSLGAGISSHLSGRDNVFVAGALHGLSRRELEARYREIADFAELDDAALATPVRYYSAGMRTRLGFAIAATLEPDLLLLDEVLATGDVAFREKSAARVRELADRSRCVVFTSHNPRFLREHADRVLWLHGGRALAFGPAGEVLDEYTRFMRAA